MKPPGNHKLNHLPSFSIKQFFSTFSQTSTQQEPNACTAHLINHFESGSPSDQSSIRRSSCHFLKKIITKVLCPNSISVCACIRADDLSIIALHIYTCALIINSSTAAFLNQLCYRCPSTSFISHNLIFFEPAVNEPYMYINER